MKPVRRDNSFPHVIQRNLNVDDEVSKWRQKAGWYDDDKRMKAFNDGALSDMSSSTTTSYKDKQYWINLFSTMAAFISALLVMIFFFQYLKYTLGSSPDETDTASITDAAATLHRSSRSRSRSRRRSKSRRGNSHSRSRSYHQRNKDSNTKRRDMHDMIPSPSNNNTMEEDSIMLHGNNADSPTPMTTEYTLMENVEQGGRIRSTGTNTAVVGELISPTISPTSTEGATMESAIVPLKSPTISYLGQVTIT